MTKVLLLYLAAINLIAFCAMGLDKFYATHQKWRIPEKTLFLFAVLGGSAGGGLGMYLFRHKTRKPLFYIGFPLILLIQLGVAVFVWYYF